MTHEQNNTLTLNRNDLSRNLSDLFAEVTGRKDRMGLPRFSYKDEFDRFEMRVESTNVGYGISCALNNSTAYQLNGYHFHGRTQIGTVMLQAAGAKNQTINEFFG